MGNRPVSFPYCFEWVETVGTGTLRRITASLWRLDKTLADRLRNFRGKDLRPVILESTGRFAQLACGQARCCGYKDPLTEATIFEPTALACSAFFKRWPHVKEADAAIVFLSAGSYGSHSTNQEPNVYIINNQGGKKLSCSKLSSKTASGRRVWPRKSADDLECRNNDEECLRYFISCGDGGYCCETISSSK